MALATVAASHCGRVLRINSADELPDDISGVVAVTAGASAPERLVEEVVRRLSPREGVDVVADTIEDEYFPPPPELREFLKSLAKVVDASFSPLADDSDPVATDRERSAATVLVATP